MKPVSNWANRTSQKKQHQVRPHEKSFRVGLKPSDSIYIIPSCTQTLEHPPFIDDFPSELNLHFRGFPSQPRLKSDEITHHCSTRSSCNHRSTACASFHLRRGQNMGKTPGKPSGFFKDPTMQYEATLSDVNVG